MHFCLLLCWCWTWNNVTCLHYHHLHPLYMSSFICLQLGPLDACIVCESNFLPWCGSSISSHVIISMFNSSISGIPSSIGPSPGTTKKLHLAYISFCLNPTVHVPEHSILDWFYDFNMAELFFVVHKAASVDLGKSKNLKYICDLHFKIKKLYILVWGIPVTWQLFQSWSAMSLSVCLNH